MGYSHRFRWSPVLLVTLGLVLCSVLCLGFTSAATRERKNIQNNWSRPDRLRDQEESYYYTEESKDYYNKRRSPSPPPTTDDDYFEKRRGAFDTHGRTLIFKSLILAPLAMVVLIILAVLVIPIPILSSPIGRSFQAASFSAYASSLPTLKMAREVLTSEECVERVSCELSKISRTYESTSWIPSTLEKLLVKAKWSERIVRGINGISPSACTQFTCTPAKHLKRTLKSAVVKQ